MHTKILATTIAAAVVLLVLTNANLFFLNQKTNSNIETVKSQLANAKSGIASFPVTDYSLLAMLSVSSFAIGIGAGVIAADYFLKPKTNYRKSKKSG